MGSARSEITGGLMIQPTTGNDVLRTTDVSTQWFAMCHADEIAKLVELNQ